MEKLLEVLRGLDPQNDAHWTQDGAARLDYVSEQVGVQITRAQIIEAAPQFSRANVDVVKPKQPVNPFAAQQDADDGKPENLGTGGEGGSVDGDGSAGNCVIQETGQTSVLEMSDEQRIEDEYNAARANMEKAQRRLHRANEAMDELIRMREASEQNVSFAHNVQSYLAKQKQELHRDVATQEKLKKMLQGLQNEM